MSTIFMNSENSKTSNPHRMLLNLLDKIDLVRSDMLFYQILLYMEILSYYLTNLTIIYYTWENIKIHTKQKI